MGIGFDDSSSTSTMDQSVWGPQGSALEGLYGQAKDLYGRMGGYQQQIDQQAQGLTPQMQAIADQSSGAFQQQLGGGSFGDTADVRSRLMENMGQPSQMGQMYESIVGGPGNTYIDPMVDAMKSGAMENLDLMQSTAGLDASAMGQGGSSRHAMQNAMLARGANQDMIQQEANMRGGAYGTDLGMKMDIARMADTNRQSEQDRMMGMLSGADANRQGGMNYGQNLQNLTMGTMAPTQQAMNTNWGNINQYADILGGPQVLSQGTNTGVSSGTNVNATGIGGK